MKYNIFYKIFSPICHKNQCTIYLNSFLKSTKQYRPSIKIMNLDAEQQKKVVDTEHLMNVVVEMRNIYGAACIQHSQKSSVIEQQLLQLKLDSLSKTSFKSKTIPDIDAEETMRGFNEFNSELDEFCKRVELLQHRTKNVKAVVHQMRRANPVLGAHEPLTANMLLAKAKNKNRD